MIAVLPTGFGKSLLLQLLPDVMHTKSCCNIVIVVCPLTSIIEDQMKILKDVGINAKTLHTNKKGIEVTNLIDEKTEDGDYAVHVTYYNKCKILFAHPEDLLSEVGKTFMKFDVFKSVLSLV